MCLSTNSVDEDVDMCAKSSIGHVYFRCLKISIQALFMCGGIQYQNYKIFFPQSDAKLPVKLRHGGITWVTWGRRKEESNRFPNGGWLRLNSIKMSKWKPWHPRSVLNASWKKITTNNLIG